MSYIFNLTFLEMESDDLNTSCMTYLRMDTVHLAKWVVDRGRGIGSHRSDERTFISVGCLIRVCTGPANIHDVET